MIGRNTMVTSSMMKSVRWLDEAFQTVRLELGSIELGRMNGNIDRPTVAITPRLVSDDPMKTRMSRPSPDPDQRKRGACKRQRGGEQGCGIAPIVVQPRTRHVGARRQPGVGCAFDIHRAHDRIAETALCHINPAGHEQQQAQRGGDLTPSARARCATGPSSAFKLSQPVPCSASIDTESNPLSSVNGVNKPKRSPS